MKHLNGNISLFIIFLAAVLSVKHISGQKTTKREDTTTIENGIKNKRFIFYAQTALPMRMTSRNLTTDYEVKVAGDTLISSLPYFGRAYKAEIGSVDSPLDFTSTAFSYTVSAYKKNGWNVVINVKDREGLTYSFTLFNNGSASLNVTSTSRDPISFRGYVTAIK
ncbi:MAG TPA: DUF4251 domain-containing protein [Chitinophagaceae bacterium]|nr:DUF4251 domain-containing protein [Chitinophagaceae bacterium]